MIHFIFQTATSGIYKEVYDGIQKDPTNIVGIDEGYMKVRQENYAYIGDETMLSINASDDCSLSLINERFFQSGFGIVVPKGWPYKKYFDAV